MSVVHQFLLINYYVALVDFNCTWNCCLLLDGTGGRAEMNLSHVSLHVVPAPYTAQSGLLAPRSPRKVLAHAGLRC